MRDRQSDGNDKATIGEGVVGIEGDPKTLNQLSSSGRAAQQKRMGKALESLEKSLGTFRRSNKVKVTEVNSKVKAGGHNSLFTLAHVLSQANSYLNLQMPHGDARHSLLCL
jgi:hypothetical protein